MRRQGIQLSVFLYVLKTSSDPFIVLYQPLHGQRGARLFILGWMYKNVVLSATSEGFVPAVAFDLQLVDSFCLFQILLIFLSVVFNQIPRKRRLVQIASDNFSVAKLQYVYLPLIAFSRCPNPIHTNLICSIAAIVVDAVNVVLCCNGEHSGL